MHSCAPRPEEQIASRLEGLDRRYETPNDKDEDILTIDHAEEIGSVIAHFTADGRPILLEILDAGEFLSAAIRTITGAEDEVALG